MKDRKIKDLWIEGWDLLIVSTPEEPITLIKKYGEMAMVDWYAKGDEEYNGRYIIRITYEKAGENA